MEYLQECIFPSREVLPIAMAVCMIAALLLDEDAIINLLQQLEHGAQYNLEEGA